MVRFEVTVVAVCLIQLCRKTHQLDPISSKSQSEKVERIRCGYDIETLWTAELAHSPFAAAPLIADVDGNGQQEIIAAPFSESFTVLQGQNGHVLHHSSWPAVNLDNSVHASPIQFDVNHDGMLDIVFTLSSGELRFYTPDGKWLKDKTYQISPVYVSKAWYQYELILTVPDIDKYASVVRPSESEFQHVVPVDAHVLSTPVLVDLNNDLRVEELVVSVSYFFEEEDFRSKDSGKQEQLNGLKYEDIGKFLLSGITVVNLTSMEPIWTKILDLTQISAEFPAYNLFTPTVVDIEGDFSAMEIILGTSAGNLFILDHHGKVKEGWPKSSGSIHGQISVADLDGDNILDIVSIDTSGDVICYNTDGKTIWETQISGTSTAGSRMYDVNKDGILDVITATNTGDIYAVDGSSGKVLPNWPLQFGKKIFSNVLITKISSKHSTPDMLVLTDDGYLHVISMDLKCKANFLLGETSLVQLLSWDLMQGSEGLEVLVATKDGALICLGNSAGPKERFTDEEKSKERIQYSLRSETNSPNDFIYGQLKVRALFKYGTLLLLSSVCFHVLAVLFGAPFLESTAETFHFGMILSSTVVVPALCLMGTSMTHWIRVFAQNSPELGAESIVYYSTVCSIIGAWLGAFPIPLDWDRPWQEWPITCVIGTLFGYCSGVLIGIVHLYVNYYRIKRIKIT